MQSAIGLVLGGVIGAVLGGLGGLFGRIAYDHWAHFPLDYDYGAGLVGISGAVAGAMVGALIGICLAAVEMRTRLWALFYLALIVLVGAGLLAVVLNPYWIATHWGERAYLVGAHLPRANLRALNLSGANLHGADLSGAILTGANLQSAVLGDAHLRGADLTGANLRNAVLTGADLREATLRNADLRDAILELANVWEGTRDGGVRPTPSAELTGVEYDQTTRWPDGFDPQQHGAVLVK